MPFWTARTSELGVQIFFVISGFIISIVGGPGRFDPFEFARRRALRIVPLYWLCTTALFAAALAAPTLFKTTTASWSDYGLSLLFVPHRQAGEAAANLWSPLLKPGWTLNLEVFFYAVTAALFCCPQRRLRAVFMTVALGALVALGLAGAAPGVLAFYGTTNLVAFLCGVWLAELTHDREPTAARWPALALGGLALAGLTGTYAVPDDHTAALVAQAAAVLIVAAGLATERAGLLPRWPALKRVGDASYSLYLTHMFTLGLGWAVLRRFADPAAGPVHAAGVALIVAAAIPVALVSFRVVEQPFIRLSKRPDRPRPRALRPAPAGAPPGYSRIS